MHKWINRAWRRSFPESWLASQKVAKWLVQTHTEVLLKKSLLLLHSQLESKTKFFCNNTLICLLLHALLLWKRFFKTLELQFIAEHRNCLPPAFWRQCYLESHQCWWKCLIRSSNDVGSFIQNLGHWNTYLWISYRWSSELSSSRVELS